MVIVNPSSLVCYAKTYSLKRIESHNSNMVMTEILPAHNQNVLGETHFFLFVIRDAVSLARCRLCSEDPILTKLYTEWANHLVQENSYEQAAQW